MYVLYTITVYSFNDLISAGVSKNITIVIQQLPNTSNTLTSTSLVSSSIDTTTSSSTVPPPPLSSSTSTTGAALTSANPFKSTSVQPLSSVLLPSTNSQFFIMFATVSTPDVNFAASISFLDDPISSTVYLFPTVTSTVLLDGTDIMSSVLIESSSVYDLIIPLDTETLDTTSLIDILIPTEVLSITDTALTIPTESFVVFFSTSLESKSTDQSSIMIVTSSLTDFESVSQIISTPIDLESFNPTASTNLESINQIMSTSIDLELFNPTASTDLKSINQIMTASVNLVLNSSVFSTNQTRAQSSLPISSLSSNKFNQPITIRRTSSITESSSFSHVIDELTTPPSNIIMSVSSSTSLVLIPTLTHTDTTIYSQSLVLDSSSQSLIPVTSPTIQQNTIILSTRQSKSHSTIRPPPVYSTHTQSKETSENTISLSHKDSTSNDPIKQVPSITTTSNTTSFTQFSKSRSMSMSHDKSESSSIASTVSSSGAGGVLGSYSTIIGVVGALLLVVIILVIIALSAVVTLRCRSKYSLAAKMEYQEKNLSMEILALTENTACHRTNGRSIGIELNLTYRGTYNSYTRRTSESSLINGTANEESIGTTNTSQSNADPTEHTYENLEGNNTTVQEDTVKV